MSRIATTYNDIAGYAAIAVAVGLAIEEAWDLVVELDSARFHSTGRALAVDVAKVAQERVAESR